MIEVLKQAYQLLLTEPHAPTVCDQLEVIFRQAIKEHAMYEVQRLGQEIEQEPVAWMHIMDNTEGIKANGAGIVSITQKRKHPFGKAGIDFSKSYPVTSTPLYTHPPQHTEQKPVECDGDFPEGFDKSLDIPAQALRQANAALCEVTNNRMWDVPALAERMLMFCRNTHPPQRTWVGLTGEMLLKAAQSSLSPEQYDHFEAMSKYQPDIYDRLAYAIRVQDE